MAAVQVTTSAQEPKLLAVDATRADRVLSWGAPDAGPSHPVRETLLPDLADPVRLAPGRLAVTVDLQDLESPSPLRLTARLDENGRSERIELGQLRSGRHTYQAELPAGCTADGCRLAALAVDHPGTDIESATATLLIESMALTPAAGGAAEPLVDSFRVPSAWRPGAPTLGAPQVVIQPGAALKVQVLSQGGPFAEIVRGDSPEPLPALVGRKAEPQSAEAGGGGVDQTTGMSGLPTRFNAVAATDYVPRAGDDAVLVDLDLALRLDSNATTGDRQVWLSRDDPAAERQLRGDLKRAGITVASRETRGGLERVYAGDGAVLALRLLLVCGAAAVVVAVGALLVAAYVGRRQRAYEVAALRVVGLRRRTVRALLLRENVGTVLVALVSGALAASVATWVVLPALPQFDDPSLFVEVRYAPDVAAAWAAIGGLGLLLVAVGLAVAALQLHTGRPDRLREGVR